jgi:serine/threonine protein kinase
MMSPTTLQGQTLGKYEILEPLGRGGMAQVYRAYHPQLDRFVAIKILRGDLIEEPEFQARFRREARAVAALRHAHIVHIYDFDVQDDYYYMVMELLGGDTLKATLNRQRSLGAALPLDDLTRILSGVLDGLAYAHAEGITHRDIKPANILLTRRGEAVLTDFGIAQIVGGTSYTLSGVLMGTPHYMSPEQGRGEKVDHRSDLYSLGILVYEMLAGHPPFEADTPLAILMKHLHDPLPLGGPARRIPAPFEPLLLKALAKAPEDRYQSAEEMSAALREAAAACGVQEASAPRPVPPPVTAARIEDTPVYSGAARESISNAEFAADETDANLGQHLGTAGLTPETEMADGKLSRHKRVTQAALTGVGLLVGGNLLAVSIGIFSRSWALFQFGWPAELLLVAALLLLIMSALEIVWMLIPVGIILGNGLIMAYFSLTGFWGHWTFVWPLEPALVFGVIGLTLYLSRRPAWTSRWVRPLGLWGAGGSGLMAMAIGWLSMLVGLITRLFHK